MLRRALLPCLLVLLAAPAASASAPVAAAAKTCSIKGKERRLGTTYVFTLKASGTSCGAAQGVVKAFHACRHKHGKAGKCSSKVMGYRCKESRFDKIATQYSARVTCTKSRARVKHAYQQNT